MPYTASQLTQFYTTLTFGNQPSAATTAAINTAAAADAAGTITDAQAFAAVNYMLTGVRSTVDVAVSTYALFTGATPTQAGINYLINNPGTGYNTAYYNGVGGSAAAPAAGGFNAENRYYNAAINLAATVGSAGYTAFNATYGTLSLPQAISTAYGQIIGVSAVGSTAAASAIASITSSLPYFQALAAQRTVTGSSVDLATKAIIVGYILEEAIKADVGVYAQALDGFNVNLAMGNAVFNTNLLATYGVNGTAFNAALQPLGDTQILTSAAASINSIGVVPNGLATVNVGANTTINFTGDIAINTGQLNVAVANAASNTNDVLNLNFTGQTIATAPSVLAAGVESVNVITQANTPVAAGTVLSLDLQDPALQTLTIRGNESVAYSAPLYAFLDGTFSIGALASINAAGATAPVTIDVSSAGATPNNTAVGGVAVTGTTGADTFIFRNFASITGGGGNDTFLVGSSTSVSAISSVTDDHAGNIVAFNGLKAATFRAAALTATSVQNGLDQAAALGPGTVSYFQVGGDTYLVADNSTATTFQAGNDFAVRLVGLHNLATSTINTAIGAVVLGG